MATKPAVSLPDANRFREALAACPFVVVSDCIADTDTSRYAHVKLPAAARAGEDVTVWNRTRAKAEALTEVGCAVADTIADLRGHDVVFTMVSTPTDLEQV